MDHQRCLHCNGRGSHVRWRSQEHSTDPLFVQEPCQRCGGTGYLPMRLTVPSDLYLDKPCSVDAVEVIVTQTATRRV